jgi:alpha-1,2-mannosyltransferase
MSAASVRGRFGTRLTCDVVTRQTPLRADWRMLLVLAGVALALWAFALPNLLGSEQQGLIDLRVYRTGGLAWLQGVSLYDPAFPAPLDGPRLPFTYPPLAAVIFAGLAVVPWWVAVALVVATALASLTLASWLAATRLTDDRLRLALMATGAVAIASTLEPARETISFGQVNLLLMSAIAADCLLPRTPWPRGALIGLAAAVKLTPAAFVLFFLARRQWRPALAAVGTFAAAGLLGALLAFIDSRDYWFGALLDPSRIGGLDFASNQSLRGVLHRLGLPAGSEVLAWLGLSVAVCALAVVGIRWLRGRGDDVGALLVTAAAALLMSPISWSHHWVWAVLGVLWLGDFVQRRHRRLGLLLLTGVCLVFVSAPHWRVSTRDGRELHWSLGEHLLGNAYVWVALTVVIVAAVAAARVRGSAATDGRPVWITVGRG